MAEQTGTADTTVPCGTTVGVLTLTAMVVSSMVGSVVGVGLLGLGSVLASFATVTVASDGATTADEVAELRRPSVAGALDAVIGDWGIAFVSIGLIVSVLGAYLAWTLMAAEVLYVAAKDRGVPPFLARATDRDVPVNALLLGALLSQVVLVAMMFSADAVDLAFLALAAGLVVFLAAITGAVAGGVGFVTGGTSL
ncbi:amino acid permease [Isoptericola croceus]|uniref:amino acid permease n=1 Tax=Isoptericola croceus TaxID=3031406 RepID=UPI0023F61E0F|nr:amino acid permease [Isoptericola croceus]